MLPLQDLNEVFHRKIRKCIEKLFKKSWKNYIFNEKSTKNLVNLGNFGNKILNFSRVRGSSRLLQKLWRSLCFTAALFIIRRFALIFGRISNEKNQWEWDRYRAFKKFDKIKKMDFNFWEFIYIFSLCGIKKFFYKN